MTKFSNLKSETRLKIWIGAMALILPAISTFATSSFIAGQYTQRLNEAVQNIDEIKTEFKEHIRMEPDKYLSQKEWKEFKEGRNNFNNQVISQLNQVITRLGQLDIKIDNLKK